MRRWALIATSWVDHARFALFRARHRAALELDGPVSPNLRLAALRLEPGARLRIGPGFATERQPGNRIWIQTDGEIELGPQVWLRTEYGPNHLTVYPGARIRIGPRTLVNAAMLHAKESIEIGADCLFGFGSRVIDADLHDLDVETPERIERVRIGERVWIGSDATVLRGVTIGDDCVVGARSVVTSDLPPRVLAVGAPARPVRPLAKRG